jgi:ribonuclease BN (tRNA processing enzyme)
VDAGSGIRRLGTKLIKENVKKFDMLFTHAHLDHIMGFPLFWPVYKKGVSLTVHGGSFHRPSYREVLEGIMCAPYFPVDLQGVSSKIKFHTCTVEPFKIGTILITPIYLSHPNGGFGFKFQEGKSTFVFLTDNELNYDHPNGKTMDEYVAFCYGADLLIHDAEFNNEDYAANRSFGHSLFSNTVQLGLQAKVERLGLFHLNRERTDKQVDAMVSASQKIVKAQKSTMECFAIGNSFEMTL